MHRDQAWRSAAAAAVVALFAGPGVYAQQPKTAAAVPVYKVDPFWPKPLPNKWSMQQIVDLYVDKNDHVWIINRRSDARPDEVGAPRTECCVLGPEIIEFDAAGNVLRAWGGPDYAPGWPGRLQTLAVDRQGNVWISGTMPGDGIVKFSGDGKLLWDFGHRGPKVPAAEVKQNNQRTDIFPPGIGEIGRASCRERVYVLV